MQVSLVFDSLDVLNTLFLVRLFECTEYTFYLIPDNKFHRIPENARRRAEDLEVPGSSPTQD